MHNLAFHVAVLRRRFIILQLLILLWWRSQWHFIITRSQNGPCWFGCLLRIGLNWCWRSLSIHFNRQLSCKSWFVCLLRSSRMPQTWWDSLKMLRLHLRRLCHRWPIHNLLIKRWAVPRRRHRLHSRWPHLHSTIRRLSGWWWTPWHRWLTCRPGGQHSNNHTPPRSSSKHLLNLLHLRLRNACRLKGNRYQPYSRLLHHKMLTGQNR